MTDEKSISNKKADSRPMGASRGLQESQSFIGSRQDVTSSTSSEIQGTPRPIKKTS